MRPHVHVQVAGAAAMYLQANPGASAAEVAQALQDAAHQVDLAPDSPPYLLNVQEQRLVAAAEAFAAAGGARAGVAATAALDGVEAAEAGPPLDGSDGYEYAGDVVVAADEAGQGTSSRTASAPSFCSACTYCLFCT